MVETFFRFKHHLAAGTAGRNGIVQKVAPFVAGGDGERLYRFVGILGVGVEQGGAFGAQTGGVGGVLLIGAGHDEAVCQSCGGTYREMRIGGIAASGGFTGVVYQFAVGGIQLFVCIDAQVDLDMQVFHKTEDYIVINVTKIEKRLLFSILLWTFVPNSRFNPMKPIFRLIAVATFLFAVVFVAQAQRRNVYYNEYIKQYAPLAVEQMQLHKIPASITLAQGLLESGAGRSKLACKSNNHFGIKCGSGWRGRTVRHDDDARNECFRAYRTPKESYDDHSLFLKRSARYAFLFKLEITDYKGWARGLKKAGYATDPSYANRLITIIEDYELYKYDSRGMGKREARRWEKELKKKPWLAHPHRVYIANDIAYVVARSGDSFQLLGKEFGISWKKLVSYNDLQKDYTLEAGDIIYLKEKKKKASGKYTVYIVKDGDSMHGISQKYGIRLKNLYKMNRKDAEYVPEVGDRLRLR